MSLLQTSTAAMVPGSPGKRTLTEQLGQGAAPATYPLRPGQHLPANAATLRTGVGALEAASADKLHENPTTTGKGTSAVDVIRVPDAAAPHPPTPAGPGDPSIDGEQTR